MSDATTCPTPDLFTKPLPGTNDGTLVFFWQDPACGRFFAKATGHLDPENAPEESFEVLQPTITTRAARRSETQPGLWLLGPVYKSVIVEPEAPWTAVKLFLGFPIDNAVRQPVTPLDLLNSVWKAVSEDNFYGLQV